MKTILLICILVLAGCAAPIDYAAIQRELNIQECAQIADAHEFTGKWRQLYMAQCIPINGAGIAGATYTIAPYPFHGTQYSTIGQPDPFGPYSYRGPTWEQFNQFYSQPPQR